MFYQASLQLFVNFNKFLQREDPIIPVLSDQIDRFFLRVCLELRFVSIAAIKRAKTDISTIQFTVENQLPETSLFIGIITRQVLNRVLETEDISPQLKLRLSMRLYGVFIIQLLSMLWLICL